MPCPTCNQTMHGLGESTAEQLFKELHSVVADCARRIGVAATPEWVRGELEMILRETKFRDGPTHRHFVCPNCGTVRTVTNSTGAFVTASGAKGYCIATDHISDQPPRLVELVKAADDMTAPMYIAWEWRAGDAIATKAAAWADVRRCIGREKS